MRFIFHRPPSFLSMSAVFTPRLHAVPRAPCIRVFVIVYARIPYCFTKQRSQILSLEVVQNRFLRCSCYSDKIEKKPTTRIRIPYIIQSVH